MKELTIFEENRKSKNRPDEPVFLFFLHKALIFSLYPGFLLYCFGGAAGPLKKELFPPVRIKKRGPLSRIIFQSGLSGTPRQEGL
jgi:hypothetical protein